MKSKEEGGAGLINLKERLQTIKVKALKSLMIGNWTKYFDTIVYWAATRMQLLSGQNIKGPKSETCSNKYDETIKLMVKNRMKLQDIQNMKMKEIETILFERKTITCPYTGIYRGKNVKFISLNFRIVTNILKTATNRDDNDRSCTYCHSRNETIFHLFLECEHLKPLRQTLQQYIQLIRDTYKPLVWNYIINMQELEKELEYEVITIYKKTVWNSATQIRFNHKIIDIHNMIANFEKEVHFYMRYVYDNG